MQVEKICENFNVKIVAQKEINKGIINSTTMVTDECGEKFILQEINSNVFKDVDKLMNNIARVSEYVHMAHEKSKDNIDTLNLIKCKDKYYFTQSDENKKIHYYRMYKYISNASTYDEANEQLLFQAGIGFGNFQKALRDFPANELYETIPNFHNTPLRYKKLLQTITTTSKKRPERLKKALNAIKFAKKNVDISSIITDALKNNIVPIRVVHNDTKLNNVILSDTSNKPVAVIDLDTVMPGSLLYDYGDAIRYCASTATEDETNLKLIDVDFTKLKYFTQGYLKETCNILTKAELKLMPYAPSVMAYELGIRFLKDYLDGDKYFKINSSRPNHNLERAIAQFALVKKFKENHTQIERIIYDEYNKAKKTL